MYNERYIQQKIENLSLDGSKQIIDLCIDFNFTTHVKKKFCSMLLNIMQKKKNTTGI